jgi:hypothetical protein
MLTEIPLSQEYYKCFVSMDKLQSYFYRNKVMPQKSRQQLYVADIASENKY